MENISLGTIWAFVLAAASALVLICNAAEKVILAAKAAKAPEKAQNDRITKVEKKVEDIESKLKKDEERLGDSENANRVTQEALLALLEHGLNGNNIEQMTKAKEKLQNYLINH